MAVGPVGRVLALRSAGPSLWTWLAVGITTVQDVLPGEARGLGISFIAFCNTILGLGLGPTFVAVTTEHVYGDPVAVGLGISSVALPFTLIAALLFWTARRRTT